MINRTIYNLSKHAYRKSIILFKYFLSINPFQKSHCTEKTLRCSADILNKNYQYSRLGKNTPTCCITHLYELLRDITTSLKKKNIDYFIFYGTYLGAIRHQGFIPWDTDIDLCIMAKDKNRALKVFKDDLSGKYPIETINKYWSMINYSSKNKVHADIYFMSENNDYIFLKGYEEYQYPKKSIFPLKTLAFYKLSVFTPNNLNLLYIGYGGNCLNESFHQHSYIKQKQMKFYPASINSKYFKDNA